MTRQPGETLRLIDVPVLFDGLDHIFDHLPPGLDTTDFSAWKKVTFTQMADACDKRHGAASRQYINKLIGRGPGLTKYITKGVRHFVKTVCNDKDGDVARDVAEKFGIIFVGGMLGIRYGFSLGAKRSSSTRSSKCYREARQLLPDVA